MTDYENASGDGGDAAPMRAGGRRSRQWAFGTAPRPKGGAVVQEQAELAHRAAVDIRLDRPTPTQRAVQATIARHQDAARAQLGGALDPQRAMALATTHVWTPARPPGPPAHPTHVYEDGHAPAGHVYEDGHAPAGHVYEDGHAPAGDVYGGPKYAPPSRLGKPAGDVYGGPKYAPPSRLGKPAGDVYGGPKYAPPAAQPSSTAYETDVELGPPATSYETHVDLAPPAAQPSSTAVRPFVAEGPKVASTPLETTPLHAKYAGEDQPNNKVWPGRRVRYLDADEREAKRVVVQDGRLLWLDGTPVDSTNAKSALVGGAGRAIFVMDANGNIYMSTYQKAGEFHHSSLLAGAPVAAAGEMKVVDGVVTLLTDRSGHYMPSSEYTAQLLTELDRRGLDLATIPYKSAVGGLNGSALEAAQWFGAPLGQPAQAASPPNATPPADGSQRDGADGEGGGDERSGEAEQRGDEERLGRRGPAGRGEKSGYGRWVRAFGRDQEGARASFQQHWERVAQERAATAIAQEAAKGPPVRDQVGAAIAGALQQSYEQLPPLGEDGARAPADDGPSPVDGGSAPAPASPSGSRATDADVGSAAPAGRPSGRRRFVRAAARDWRAAREAARGLGAGLQMKLKQLRHGMRRGTGDDGEGPFRADRLPPSGKWTVLEESDVARDEAGDKQHDLPKDGEDRTNVNRVDKVVFKKPIPGSDARLGFFKPEVREKPDSDHTDNFEVGRGETPRLASRAVLSSALDRALGTNVLAVEVFGRLRNPETGRMETGNISAAAPGRALQGNAHQDPSLPIKGKYHKANIVKELNNAADLRSPEVQRGLTDLQTVDWLTAQSDRHGGNIFVTDDGRVTGIDNDFAFGAADRHRVGFGEPGAQIGGQNVGMPPVMARPTADAVLAMTPERLEAVLNGSVPPGERLSAGEMAAAKSRLEKLQQGIRDGSVEVVSTFDGRTYDKLRTKKELAGRGELAASYVETHASLVEAAAAGQLGPERMMVDLESFNEVHTVNESADVDVASLAPSHAKDDVLALPASPYEAGPPGPPADDAASGRPLVDVALEAAGNVPASGDGNMALDAESMPVIDGSPPANDVPPPAGMDASAAAGTHEQATSAAAIGGVATGVEGNVRRGRSASESQASGETGRGSRSSFTLKRRSHAGASARADAKKTPARGTKDRASMPATRHHNKRKKG